MRRCLIVAAPAKATIDALRRRMGVPDNEPRPPFVSTTEPQP